MTTSLTAAENKTEPTVMLAWQSVDLSQMPACSQKQF